MSDAVNALAGTVKIVVPVAVTLKTIDLIRDLSKNAQGRSTKRRGKGRKPRSLLDDPMGDF